MRRDVWAAAFAALFVISGAARADEAAEAEAPRETPPEFTEAYLADPEAQAAGKVIWLEQCRHCHGASAYPGKAPKLKPWSYEPDFVFDRVTNGFEKMPGWIDVYSREERMAVTAYILSNNFSP